MKHVRAGLATGLLIALAAPVAQADVTVRVEGATSTLANVSVPRTGPTVSKAGGTCPGDSAGGALDRAVDGDWTATNYAFGLSVDGIRGEDYPFPADKYWNFSVNNLSASVGICAYQPQDGDEILFSAACSTATATECFNGRPLDVTAPATATVGVPFTVSVREFGDTGAASPAEGATVAGSTTGADGRATVTVTTPGTVTLTATKGDQVRDSATVTVTAPSASPTPAPSVSPVPTATATPDAEAPRSKVRGIEDGRVFAKRANAPRTLRATVKDASGLRSVRFGLARRHQGRCSAFSDERGAFERITCGERPRFRVGNAAKVSYLLPKRLEPGRYVFSVRSTDAAGNRERVAEGRNRAVFHVR